MKISQEKKLINLENKYGAHNYLPLEVVIKKGRGIWVWDINNKKYMDFLAAYSALNQGHCHPRLIRAIIKQAKQLTLTSRAFYNNLLPQLCEQLCKLSGFEKALLMNSGAEAVETAIKAARKWGYLKKGIAQNKAEIIVAKNNFHGRTTTIISCSSDKQYRFGFGPYTKGFKIVNYNDIEVIKKAINKNTAAILLEPIQGEAGVIIPKKNYLKKVKALCEKNNVLLILDEIQSSFGRTGKMFCYEWSNIKPDGLIIGKALSGGMYPISAFLSSKKVMDVFKPGDHGSTYGGNPLACAIALEAIKIIKDEKLVKKANQLGKYALKFLQKIKNPLIYEIRGVGLWLAIELNKPLARHYCEKLMSEGILCKEAHQNIIRLAPPLIIKKKELQLALKKVNKIFMI